MSGAVPRTALAREVLAKSHPEPLTLAQVAQRGGWPVRAAERAVSRLEAAGLAVRTQRLDGRQGYAYTVAAA